MNVIENAPFLKSFDSHLTKQYGEIDTPQRDAFEDRAKAFVIAEMLRKERLKANLTQNESFF